jgi:putative transcriptional regulator
MAKNLIIEGLKDAVRHARGAKSETKTRTVLVDNPLDVKAIRLKLNLSQSAFAVKFGFPTSTVRNWEQGRRQPVGAHRNLLRIIDAMPDRVEQILRAA